MKQSKTITIILIVFVSILCLTTVFTACNFIGGDSSDDDKVTFDNIVFKDGNKTLTPDGHPLPSNFVPEKEGYEFRYWITDPTNKNSVFEQQEYDGKPITLYAVWKAKVYKVKFVDYDGKVIKVDGKDDQSVEYGNSAVAPSDPEREGYTFVGWDVSFSQIKQDTTVTAVYDRTVTTVSFYYQDQLLAQKQLYVGDKISVCEKEALESLRGLTSQGFEIEGWYADEDFVKSVNLSTATATLDMNVYVKLKVAHNKTLSITTGQSDNVFEYSDHLTINATLDFSEYTGIAYSIEWYVDGVRLDNAQDKIAVIQNLTVGVHSLKAVVKSSYNGETVSDEKAISVVVNRATLRLNPQDMIISYGDEIPMTSYAVKNENGVYLGEATVVCDYRVGSPVGKYVVTLSGFTSEVYNVVFESGTLTVEPKAITVKAVDLTITYGEKSPEFQCVPSAVVGNDTFGNASFSCDYRQGNSVGAYVIKVSGLNNANYTITEFIDGTLTVERMELVLKVVCSNLYYGDDVPAEFGYTVREGEILDGDNLGTPNYTTNYEKGSPVGKYWANMSGLKNDNYHIQVNRGNFQVQAKPVETVWHKLDSYTYNGSDQSDTIFATYTDIDGVSVGAIVAFSGKSTIFKNADTYSVIATISDTNYKLTNSVITVEIAKKQAIIKVKNMAIDYGDDVPKYEYSVEGLEGDDVFVTPDFICDYVKGSDVGEYSIKAGGLINANYNIVYQDAILEVRQLEAEVLWTMGESYVYNGAIQSDAIVARFVRPDGKTTILTLSYSINGVISDFKNAGEYSVIAKNSNNNYKLLNNEKTVIIAPKDVNIVFDSASVIFGDDAPEYRHTITGMVEGETASTLGKLSYVCDYTKGSDVGSYSISGEGLSNSNYNVIYQNGVLTVDKLAVTAEWSYRSDYVYNGVSQSDTVTARFLQYTGEYADMEVQFVCGIYNDFYHAGDYTLTAVSSLEKNYEVSNKTRELSIAKKAVTVSGNNFDVLYGDAVPDYSATIDGLFYGDSLGAITYTCDYAVGSPVNEYVISLSGCVNDDYEIEYVSSRVKCLLRSVELSWQYDNSYVYNRLDQSASVTATFIGYDDSVNTVELAFVSADKTVFKNAGVYTVKASFEDKNYLLSNDSVTIAIEPKAVVIDVADVIAVYGDPTVDFVIDINGLIEGDSMNKTLLFDYVQGETAQGTYVLDVDYVQDENYKVTVNKGNLTVLRKSVSVDWNYGSYVYDGSDRSSTVSAKYTAYDGSVVEMNVKYSGASEIFKNAGEYTLTASHSDDNYSYEDSVRYVGISKKALTVSVVSKTIEFGNQVEFTMAVDGLIDGDSLGDYDYSCLYAVGSPINDYDITLVGIENDNYDITVNNSVLKVIPRSVNADWVYGELIYNGKNRLNEVKCVYPDYLGNDVEMSLDMTGDFAEFKNAGKYTFTATSDDANYNVQGVFVQELTILKADYVGVAHRTLSGTYNPDKRLSDYVLDDNYRWENPEILPTVPTTEYRAIYNADSVNYNDYSLIINLSLTKAVFTDVAVPSALTGTYDGAKLSSFALANNYFWSNPDEIPVVKKTSYDAYYNSDKDNYFDYKLSVTLTLAKGTYSGITHEVLSGTYNPDKHLSDYVLSANYRWENPEILPTVPTTEYRAIYNADSDNYNDCFLDISLVLEKANYTGITHKSFNGTYDPNKRLSDYVLDANYRWKTPETLPTVPTTKYKAIYNADSDNYNDYEFDVSVNLTKAVFTDVAIPSAMSGTYRGTKLSSFALASNYYWSNPDEIPVVKKTSYDAYYNSDKDNYFDFAVTITLTLAKGTYSGITHKVLSGTYDPNKTLASYALSDGFAWKTTSLVPTCNVTEYNATYNGDPDNYNTLNLTITLNLAKATVTLAQTSWTADYNTTGLTIAPTVNYNGSTLSSSNYVLVYSNGSKFIVGGIHTTVVTIDSQNYTLNPTTCTVTINSVCTSSNTTLTTLEDALNSASNGTVIIKYPTKLNNTATVKSGVTLLVPYSSSHDATAVPTSSSSVSGSGAYVTLTVSSGVILYVKGTLNVNGIQLGGSSGAIGHTTGQYGQMVLEKGSLVDVYGTAYLTGFVTGSGQMIINNGAKAHELLQIKDWPGGKVAYSVYDEYFPFTQFAIANVEAKLTVKYGAVLSAHYYLIVSKNDFKGELTMFGSGGLFEIADSNGSVDKSVDASTGKITITSHGKVKTNNVSLSIKVSIATVNMETKGKYIPICGYYNIIVGAGSTVTLNTKFRLLPGSSFTVEKGGTCTIASDGGLIGYTSAYTNSYTGSVSREYGGNTSKSSTRIGKVVYNSSDEVKMLINGTVTVSGTFGGNVTTSVAGSKLNLSGASGVSGSILSLCNIGDENWLGTKYKYTTSNYNYTVTSNGQTLGKSNYTGQTSGYFA